MKRILSKEEWLFIAENYEKLGPTKLSLKFGVAYSTIMFVRKKLIEVGVKIAPLKVSRAEVIEFVKKNVGKKSS